jgi:tellurite resistance protein TehA-like permease
MCAMHLLAAKYLNKMMLLHVQSVGWTKMGLLIVIVAPTLVAGFLWALAKLEEGMKDESYL